MSKVHIGRLQPATGRMGAGHADPVQTGTVSQYVLRNAPCPVLVVPGGRGAG